MNTEIDFCGIKMKNPVTVASGTFFTDKRAVICGQAE